MQFVPLGTATGLDVAADRQLAGGVLVGMLLLGAAAGAVVGEHLGLQTSPRSGKIGAVLGSAPALGALAALAYAYTHKQQVANWFHAR